MSHVVDQAGRSCRHRSYEVAPGAAWLTLGAMLAAVGGAFGEPGAASRPGPRSWETVGKIDRTVIREESGVVESRRQPGVFWTHADSGNPSKLVAFEESGRVVAEVTLAVPNTDWEDICADDAGHLYIGDIGNNKGIFPSRYVYQIDEPDPRDPPTGPIRPREQYHFTYPDDQRFDAESLFWLKGSLYILRKSLGSGPNLFRLDRGSDGHDLLVPVATLPTPLASGADASPDGAWLVVCTYGTSWLYPIVGGEQLVDRSGVRQINYPVEEQIEGCCFAGDGVLLLSEPGRIHRVNRDDFANQTRFSSDDPSTTKKKSSKGKD